MKNKKGAIGLIVGIIVALVVVGGIAYVSINNGDSTETPSDADDSDSNSGNSVGDGWCTGDFAEDIYSSIQEGGVEVKIIEARATGLENYKGKIACHAYVKAESTANGQTITSEADVYSYSQSQNKEDLDAWVLTRIIVSGKLFTYDYHWENGECIEGNGCEFS